MSHGTLQNGHLAVLSAPTLGEGEAYGHPPA